LIKIDLNRSHQSDEKIDVINMLAYYVGQLTGPANYDPNTARNPIERFQIEKRANFKKDLVLSQLLELGLINKSLYLNTTNRRLSFNINEIVGVDYDPNIDLIKHHFLARDQSIIGGKIKTTLIKKIQNSANYQLLKTRTALSMLATKTYIPSKVRFFRKGGLKQYGIYRVQVLKRDKRAVTINLGEKYEPQIIRVPEYLSTKTLKLFDKGKSISVGIDGFDDEGVPLVSLIQKDPLIKGAFIVKGLTDGEVLTFGGGRYLTARISPGSTIKPFLLHKALSLNWTLDDQLNNSCDLKYGIFSQPYYSPRNYGSCNESKKGFEKYPTLKTVIKESINKPVVYLLSHLTAKLSEEELRNQVVDSVKEYQSDNLEIGDFVYQLNHASMDFSIVSDDNIKRFIGRLSLAGKRDKLLFEKIRKERYLELTTQHSYGQMTDVLDYDYNEFLKWYSFVNDIVEQFQMLKDIKRRGAASSDEAQPRDSNEIAALNHFFYDSNGRLAYDPHLRDNITFVNIEVLTDFLEKYKVSDVKLGAFTVRHYLRFDDMKEDLKELSDSEFNERLFVFDPEFQEFLNVEIFKKHLAALLDIDKSLIQGDFSLPLGTYRISLIDLVNMYSQILTKAENETDIKNNQTIFIKQQENTKKIAAADFRLNEESGVYKALFAARNEKGGTSSHLKSTSILAGKTGTDPKYKTYVSVVDINGRLFLAAAYFGVDHNKHEKLVSSWTGGWTTGVFVNNIVTDINKNHLNFFPSEEVTTIEFDESFEYDSTTDSIEAVEEDVSGDIQELPEDDQITPDEESDQKKVEKEIDDLNDESLNKEVEEEDSGIDESEYTSEDIDNILKIEE
ncbi:hypothetical protein KKA14_04705, partial [bacterium]|nr:hypothetical protein [bacterium]